MDEALAGFATKVEVILHADQSLEVIDNGRGMPVDIHPTEGVSGVEVILTKLHAGGKFSNKNYEFAGGLHGVGISVVNALSERVDIQVKRNGEVYKLPLKWRKSRRIRSHRDLWQTYNRYHCSHSNRIQNILIARIFLSAVYATYYVRKPYFVQA